MQEDDVLKFIQEKHLENFDVRDVCQVLEKVPKGNVEVISK